MTQPMPITEFMPKSTCTGRLTADAGDYVEVVIPGQYGHPDRVVRIINASHRIVVLFDDEKNENVGDEFKACLDSSRVMMSVNRVELA